MLAEATHQMILFEYARKTSKPILELGAGDSSTRQLHAVTDNLIVTLDDHLEWLVRYYDLRSDRHFFIEVKDFLKYFEKDNDEWGLVFVDASTWEIRKAAIKKYTGADYVVIHDADYMFSAIMKREEFAGLYKYFREYTSVGSPTTVVASNKFKV